MNCGRTWFLIAATGGALAACSDPTPSKSPEKQAPAAPAAAPQAVTPAPEAVDHLAATPAAGAPPSPILLPAALPAPPVDAAASPQGKAINGADDPAVAKGAKARRQGLIRAEVLLDRARFSPGVIDGAGGDNLKSAILAYQNAHGLTPSGRVDPATWDALTQGDGAPVVRDYVITADDVKGPFLGTLPATTAEQAKLDHLGYATAAEGLAEKFHMDEGLLKSLNPQSEFAVGATILVTTPRTGALPRPVARIEVDKGLRQVRALDDQGALLAVYPATVGSADRPAPSGEWAVRAIARNPTWNYDPKRLTFGDAKGGKQMIAAGPNNPVGSVWIGLTKDTYGIHGTPDPAHVAKAASHGCVRLTNWDAEDLAAATKKGVKVVFVGVERAARAKKA